MNVTRRSFLQIATAAAAAGRLAEAPARAAASRPAESCVCLFTKPLGARPVEQLPDLLHELQFDAIDLTCRPEGHVLPERAADDLPRAVERMTAAGIRVAMLTTAITDANADHAETIMRTAAALGIRYLKLGYYNYKDLRQIPARLADVQARLRDLAAMARRHGLTLGFHNHSGLMVGSPLWDLHGLLTNVPAESVGSYFDPAHATVEGGDGGWRIGLHLLAPRIVMLAVKDFAWAKRSGGDWRPQWGPLGQGMVLWPTVLQLLRQHAFRGPISLHVEYLKPAPPGSDAEKNILRAITRDRATLLNLLGKAGLR